SPLPVSVTARPRFRCIEPLLCLLCSRAARCGQDGFHLTVNDCIGCAGTQEVANLKNSRNGKRVGPVPENKAQLKIHGAHAALRRPATETPSDLGAEALRGISTALNTLLADMFALYMKTKNFHWHMSGPHFRDFHLLLDDQADRILAVTDVIAERVRKVGAPTLRSIGDISRRQRFQDNDAEGLTAFQMLAELR